MKITKDDIYYCIPVLGTAIGIYKISSSLKSIITEISKIVFNKLLLINCHLKKLDSIKFKYQKNIDTARINLNEKVSILFFGIYLLIPTVSGTVRILLKKYNEWQVNILLNLAQKKFENEKYSEALPLFEKAAQKGSIVGAKMAGKIYFKGLVKKSDTKAFEYLSKSAYHGDLESKIWLGILYYEKRMPSNNLKENAIHWFSLASDQGSPEASFYLGEIYFQEQNYAQSLNFYLKASKGEHEEAIYKVGKILLDKQVLVSTENSEAISWLTEAALRGHLKSQWMLGQMYEKGKYTTHSLEESFKFYLLAAKQGHLESQKKIAHMYRHGEGVEKSLTEGYRWSKRATDQEDPESIYNLGYLLEKGIGIEPSIELAIKQYEIAINMDAPPAQAFYRLGMIHYNRKAYDISFKLFSKGVNHEYKTVLNKYMMAVSYQKGLGILQDYDKAIEFYEKVINEGNQIEDRKLIENAQMEVILIKKKKKTPEEYINELIKQADEGNIKQQIRLANCYLNGDQTRQDRLLAAKYALKALMSGSSEGEAILLKIYSLMKRQGKKRIKAETRTEIFNFLNQNPHKEINFIKYLLANMYLYGYGVKKSKLKAFKKLQELSVLNYAEGQHRLAKLLLKYGDLSDKTYRQDLKLNKDNLGEQEKIRSESTEKMTPKALDLIKKAATQGLADAQYDYSTTLDSNEEALNWLKCAASQDHRLAMQELGRRYKEGDGIPQSIEEAKMWLKKAAKNKDKGMAKVLLDELLQEEIINKLKQRANEGDDSAKTELGRKYLEGDGVPKSVIEAKQWLEQAASTEITAQNLLDEILRQEQIIDELKRKANEGNDSAKTELGRRYLEGDGVSRSLIEAKKWLEQTASTDTTAKELLNKLLLRFY